MKKIKISIVSLMLAVSNVAYAASVEIDGICYEIVSKAGIALVIKKTGGYLGDIKIPATVSYNGNECIVTSIEESAFEEQNGADSHITSIELPEGLKTIKKNAFKYCTGLKSIYIPNSVDSIEASAFYQCQNLRSVHLSENLKVISDYSFNGCPIEEITIPRSVIRIENSAFQGGYFEEITIPKNVQFVGRFAFGSCKNLISVIIEGDFETDSDYNKIFKPYSVMSPNENWGVVKAHFNCKEIKSCFRGMHTLKYVTIGTNVEKIGDFAFCGCQNLESFTIPDNVIEIGHYAFDGCYNFCLNLPPNIETIGNGAFSACCGKIDSIFVIPQTVKTIGKRAFAWCPFKSVVIPDHFTTISNSLFAWCTELNSIDIPNAIESINDSAFYGCSNIVNMEIPNTVKAIGDYSFSGCKNLKKILLPSEINTIGSYLFADCTSLIDVVIPSNVRSINEGAFSGCKNLESVSVPSNLLYIGNNSFENCSALRKIIVPDCVAIIGRNAFQNCINLRDFNFPTSTTAVEYMTFYGCEQLTTINIPAVTSIRMSAFNGCKSLSEIKLGAGLKDVQRHAFANCPEITHVYCSSLIAPLMDTNVFDNSFVNYATLHVPSNAVEEYKNKSPWNDFNEIKGDPSLDTRIEVNGITYNLISDSKCEVVNNASYSGKIVIPEYITYKGNNYSVTSIGSSAFAISYITSVEIPNSIKAIGARAFEECRKLTVVKMGTGVEVIGDHAFSMCENLTTCPLSNSVAIIGNYAFSRCNGFTSVNIPNSVLKVGVDAFAYCINLSSVSLSENVSIIEESTFIACTKLTSISIPNNIKTIKMSAFQESGLESVKIGTGVEKIESSAFISNNLKDVYCYAINVPITNENAFLYGNKGNIRNATLHVLKKAISDYQKVNPWKQFKEIVEIDGIPVNTETEMNGIKYKAISYTEVEVVHKDNYSGDIVIPETVSISDKEYKVTSIGEEAFAGCSAVNSIHIPNSVKTIRKHAFDHCNFTSINLPDEIELIDSCAFYQCGNLESIKIPTSVEKISFQTFWFCTSLKSIEIPSTIEIIESAAFWGCTSLKTITIPHKLKKIYWVTFRDCEALESIIIPDNVETIGNMSFTDCRRLRTIVLGKSVNEIGQYAFNGCYFESIYCLNTTPPQLNRSLTDGGMTIGYSTSYHEPFTMTTYKDGLLYVPIGSKEAYQNDGKWGKFNNIIEFDPKSFDPYTLGINTVSKDKKEVNHYSLDGRKLSTPSKGINIIKMNNGTVKKVLVK